VHDFPNILILLLARHIRSKLREKGYMISVLCILTTDRPISRLEKFRMAMTLDRSSNSLVFGSIG